MTRALALVAALVPALATAQPGDEAPTDGGIIDEGVPEPPPEPAKPPPAPEPPKQVEEEKPPAVSLAGYLQPSFSIVHRGDAVPRDRLRYGAESTRAGIVLSGTPISRWSYYVEVVVAGENYDLVTDVATVDTNGDGVPDDVAPTTERLPGVFVERAVLEVDVGAGVSLVAGQQRIPFTVQEQSPSTALMFPGRSGPNEVFVQGPDLGAELVYKAPGERVVARVGAFNGTGEPVDASSQHGLVYSARLDINPLGEFPVAEANLERGPLRIGIGAGALYYASVHYDAAGFPGAQQRDLRASASFRLGVSGLYVQAEALRRQRTDSLSNRPEITSGAYAQASWYQPMAIGIAPLARLGWAAEDQGFAERTTMWIEAGFALYPNVDKPDVLRILVEYLGERRITEGEQANGGVIQAQLLW